MKAFLLCLHNSLILMVNSAYYDDVLPAPYIRTRCNLEEPTGRAFCIDPARRDPPYNWDVINGHSCKPNFPLQEDGSGGFHRDEQWSFGDPDGILSSSSDSSSGVNNGGNIGFIYGASELIDSYCLRLEYPLTLESVTGDLCSNDTTYNLWKYCTFSGTFINLGISVQDYLSDSYSESSSDSNEGELCLRVGLVSVNSNNPEWRRKDLFVEDCDEITGESANYDKWDIITEANTDLGPQC